MWGFTTHKRDLSLPTYSLGTILKSVKCVKDLGIMMLHKSLVHPVIEYAAPAWNPYVLARDVLALERIQRRALSACSRAKTWWDGIRRSKWPTLETRRLFLSLVECYWRSFLAWTNWTLATFLNLPSAIQPSLTIRISCMLSQQSVIHINIIFLPELYGTGIVYQDLLLRLGAWAVLWVHWSAS